MKLAKYHVPLNDAVGDFAHLGTRFNLHHGPPDRSHAINYHALTKGSAHTTVRIWIETIFFGK
jgi:hypothetical protein